MATLHHTLLPNVTPSYRLHLASAAKTLFAGPEHRVLAAFFKSARHHPLLDLSAQELFVIFRPAGPIKTVRINVDVGHLHPVAVLEYYTTQSTFNARDILHGLNIDNRWTECTLELYDPYSLYISVSYISLTLPP